MDDLSTLKIRSNEIAIAKKIRNFLNKFYKNSLSKNVSIRVLDDRKVIYINTVGFSLITDIFYDIFDDISGVYSYNTKLGVFHSLGVNSFKNEISDNPKFICKLINDINKSLISRLYEYINFAKENHLNYLLNKSLLFKKKNLNYIQKLIFLRNNSNLPDDVIGIIGNFLTDDFSSYLYNIVEISELNLHPKNFNDAFYLYTKLKFIL